MGYRDIKLALSTSQNVTAAANSEDHVDAGMTIPGWEKGIPAAIIINVETVNVAGTGFTFEICHKLTEPTHDDATIYEIVVVAADLAAGSQIVLPLPQGIKMLRMIRLYYTRTGGTEDYVFSAYLTPMPTAI
uniref:Uncharacterized protein n=1 Tax=viral metagenome TaxID=1070528 RepID=A0A6M3K7S6_9ZZZZ